MFKGKWKITLLLSIITIVSIAVVTSFIVKASNEEVDYFISEEQAKALEIENVKITNISNVANKKYVTTKVKNKLNETASDIKISYVELDENENKISSNEFIVEVPLNNEEKAVIAITPQNYTNTINIVGYSYKVGNCDVDVNLENNEVNISESKDEKIKNEDYEILNLYDLEKIDDTNYRLVIGNLSEKKLGNLVLKIAEINKYDEYINVSHVDYTSILEEKQQIELLLNASRKENTLEVIGYTYDDIKNKENIDVDLKSHSSKIIKK